MAKAHASTYVAKQIIAQFPGSIPLSLLNGLNGFELGGFTATDYNDTSIAAAGDINQDGM